MDYLRREVTPRGLLGKLPLSPGSPESCKSLAVSKKHKELRKQHTGTGFPTLCRLGVMVPIHSQHRLHSYLLTAGNTRQVDWPDGKVSPKELPHEHPGSCSRAFPPPPPAPSSPCSRMAWVKLKRKAEPNETWDGWYWKLHDSAAHWKNPNFYPSRPQETEKDLA